MTLVADVEVNGIELSALIDVKVKAVDKQNEEHRGDENVKLNRIDVRRTFAFKVRTR